MPQNKRKREEGCVADLCREIIQKLQGQYGNYRNVHKATGIPHQTLSSLNTTTHAFSITTIEKLVKAVDALPDTTENAEIKTQGILLAAYLDEKYILDEIKRVRGLTLKIFKGLIKECGDQPAFLKAGILDRKVILDFSKNDVVLLGHKNHVQLLGFVEQMPAATQNQKDLRTLATQLEGVEIDYLSAYVRQVGLKDVLKKIDGEHAESDAEDSDEKVPPAKRVYTTGGGASFYRVLPRKPSAQPTPDGEEGLSPSV